MKKILEGSRAIAETINHCQAGVVSAYPITPQTHIVEELAQLKADGEASFEYVLAESEFAAASIVLGASAAGVRAYTATSAQGLLLMIEVLFNIAGLRLPIVMTCANRAVSGPINIWNDQQDAFAARDSGWLMFYGEHNQEVCDLHILAYKVAEKLSLPVMVNLDGFVLTHVVEPVEIEERKKIERYLPAFQPAERLDPKKPLTFGAFATPEHYFEIRQELHDDIALSPEVIKAEMKSFERVFGRKLNLVEYYGPKNADTILVAIGSVVGTMKEAVDEYNQKIKKSKKQKNKSAFSKNLAAKVGILKIVSFRPFPDEEIIAVLKNAKNIAVIDKAISLGTEGILSTEIRSAMYGRTRAKINSFILGLGGRDITKEMIKKVADLAGQKKDQVVFVGK